MKKSGSIRAPRLLMFHAQQHCFFAKPASTNRKNRRLSFDSLRQIFTRMRKPFLLRASSASLQLAATEPEARTNCLMSSVLLTVLGNCFTKARTDCANSNVLSSRSRGLLPPFILRFGDLILIWSLGFGTWDLKSLSAKVRSRIAQHLGVPLTHRRAVP